MVYFYSSQTNNTTEKGQHMQEPLKHRGNLKIQPERLSSIARWGYQQWGRGVVIVTPETDQVYLSVEQAIEFCNSLAHMHKTWSELAQKVATRCASYSPDTSFLMLMVGNVGSLSVWSLV